MLAFQLDQDPTHSAIAVEHGSLAERAAVHALWGDEQVIASEMQEAGIASTDQFVQQRLAAAARPAMRSTVATQPI